MPTYDFECGSCSSLYEETRVVACRNDPSICPKCKQPGTRVFIKGPRMVAFPGSDWHRTRVDKEVNLIESAQREVAEGKLSDMEMDDGIAAAHDRAAKLGKKPEDILGHKGDKPPLTPEKRKELKTKAINQSNMIGK